MCFFNISPGQGEQLILGIGSHNSLVLCQRVVVENEVGIIGDVFGYSSK